MIATLTNTHFPDPATKDSRVGLPRARSRNSSARSLKQPGLHLSPSAFSLQPSVYSSPRRGISLLEVLVSVFVLTLGLMGIAMVLPAGQALMHAAAKADRATACGRAALDDVQIRGWLDPANLLQQRVDSVLPLRPIRASWAAADSGGTKRVGVVYGETFWLDPVFLQLNFDSNASAAPDTFGAQMFPYVGDYADQFIHSRDWPNRAVARRVAPSYFQPAQADPWPVPSGPPPADPIPALDLPLVSRITTWADDLVFSLEDDGKRPRLFYTWGNGEGAAAPAILPDDENSLDTDGDNTPDFALLSADNTGRYTWCASITPLSAARPDFGWDHDNDGVGGTAEIPMLYNNSITGYEVSIVVFYNRSFYCPDASELTNPLTDLKVIRERSMYAQIAPGSGGSGSLDVLLFVEDGEPKGPGWLNLRKGQWIMLKAGNRSRQISGFLPGVFKWYRVVSVDDVFDTLSDGTTRLEIVDPSTVPVDPTVLLTGRGRYVTLAGPDWAVDSTWDGIAPGFDATTDIAEAAIVDDVIGVYTRTIDVNEL